MLVLAVAGVLLATRPWQRTATTQEAVVTVVATATPTATTPVSPSASGTGGAAPAAAAPAAQATSYPDVPGNGGRECARQGSGPYAAVGTGNSTTTCPFAINVRSAYLAAGINGGTGTVAAYSPRMGVTIAMSCTGAQPVVCTGGTAGFVYIYGGRLR